MKRFHFFVFFIYTERFTDFGQAKFACGGLILGLSQFTAQLPLNIMLDLKLVEIDSKIIISLH